MKYFLYGGVYDPDNDKSSCTDPPRKKMILHEIEHRKTMQEFMSNLLSSLRSLLPPDHIKGKQSICDELEEATRYIKDLEKNVKELEHKRDMLKECSSENPYGDHMGCSSNIPNNNHLINCNYVKLNTSSGGRIEIEISARVEEGDVFPLSRVLGVLLEEGLNVVSCTSSRVNERWVYIIYCQVSDEKCIDSSGLHGRLTSAISSNDS